MSALLSLLDDESVSADAQLLLSDVSARCIKDHFANVFCNLLASLAIASDAGNQEVLFMLENELDILADQLMTHKGLSQEEKNEYFMLSAANVN